MRFQALTTNEVKPFLKWAGGKQWLAPNASAVAPANFRTYFEPFLGGGAMFFALRPTRAVLADNNIELMSMYRAVAWRTKAVVAALRRLDYSESTFYRLRPAALTRWTARAARFIYLNRTAWNGLFRVNRQGDFNVPFGRFDSPPLASIAKRVEASAPLLRKARLLACDFEEAVDGARRGDFVYVDPPYVSAHKHNGFLRYNARVFSWADQVRLRNAVRDLDRRGVSLLISNADHPTIAKLYRGFKVMSIARNSMVAGRRGYRGSVTELLISNYQLHPPARSDGG